MVNKQNSLTNRKAIRKTRNHTIQSFNIGIDVGGTFTDYVATNNQGKLKSGKVHSIPDKEADAVFNALKEIATSFDISFSELIRNTRIIVLGSTVAANTALELDADPIAMITTKGFRDVIALRRNYKESSADLRLAPPDTIIPRRQIIGITERILYDGRVALHLDEEAIRKAAKKEKQNGTKSFAVCFLFSFVNPVHELKARDIITEEHPTAHVSLSHEVLGKVREFERFSTTALSAYLSPRYERYIAKLEQLLKKSGLATQLFIMLSNGGMLPSISAKSRSVEGILSGPSGGIAATLRATEMAGVNNVITADMGGTSYDVCVISEGKPEITEEYWINRQFVGLPMLDIQTIGAGGGSIAYVDNGGALCVGPESAGADPGPACFGKGGGYPTVTDANLILGLLSPKFYHGGNIQLHYELAHSAISKGVASKLGISVNAAAQGIIRIVNNKLASAVRYLTLSKGKDVRDFTLVAFGGAAGLHAAAQARELGIKRLMIPNNASVFSAFGCLIADLKVSRSRSFIGILGEISIRRINLLLDELRKECSTPMNAFKGDIQSWNLTVTFSLRYYRQVREVSVPVVSQSSKAKILLSKQSIYDACERFHERHEEAYGYRRSEWPIEITDARIDLIGVRPRLEFDSPKDNLDAIAPEIVETRSVLFPNDQEWVKECPVYLGDRLVAGVRIKGPMIVEEMSTSIAVLDDQEISVDPFGNYVIEDMKEGVP